MDKPIFAERSKKKPVFGVILVLLLVVAIGATFFALSNDDDKKEKSVASTTTSTSTTEAKKTGVPTLETQVLIEGLENVWDLAFLPNDTMLFTERPGRLSALVDGEKKTILSVPNIFAEGEGGLMGLVVDVDYKDNSNIYICYNAKAGGKVDIRVARITLNEDMTVGGSTDIVTGIPSKDSGRHSGCRVRMDKQEHLWITTGDAAATKNSQDPKGLGGKVLRVDRDGKGVEGNLSGEFDDRIFNYGHRNLQGIVLFDKEQDGVFGFTTEHGTDRDDEINLLKSGNFGWQPGPDYDESPAMTDLKKFPDAVSAIWSSGEPTIAFSGAALLKGSQWGDYENRLAVAVLKNEELKIFNIDASYKVIGEESLLKDFGRLRSAVQGPDGNLYLTTDNSGNDKIIKVIPKL